MPFIITEPQKIEGTNLGFAVYPYHFSFQDRRKDRLHNQKLVIFELKESKFVEIEKKVFENTYADHVVPRNYVDYNLKEFITEHPQCVKDPKAVVEYFKKSIYSNEVRNDNEEVKIL